MIKNNQCQLKPDSSHRRYLIINPAVLDPIITYRVNAKDDIVIKELEEGVFHILKDGKQLAEHLNKLTDELGHSIILYSNRKEYQITQALEEFNESYRKAGSKEFPKITAMIVKDRVAYPHVRMSNPKIDDDRSFARLVAGYGLQSHEEIEILNGLSKLIDFSKSDADSYIVLDNRPSFVAEASRAGWNVIEVTSITLKDIVVDFCLEIWKSKIENYKQSPPDQHEEEKLKITERKYETSLESLRETHDSSFHNAGELQFSEAEGEKRKLIKIQSDSLSKPLLTIQNNRVQITTEEPHQQEEQPKSTKEEENKELIKIQSDNLSKPLLTIQNNRVQITTEEPHQQEEQPKSTKEEENEELIKIQSDDLSKPLLTIQNNRDQITVEPHQQEANKLEEQPKAVKEEGEKKETANKPILNSKPLKVVYKNKNSEDSQNRQDQQDLTIQEEQRKILHNEINKIASLFLQKAHQKQQNQQPQRNEVNEMAKAKSKDKTINQKDIPIQLPLISDMNFKQCPKCPGGRKGHNKQCPGRNSVNNKECPGGSSGHNRWFVDEKSKTEWIGKLSYASVQDKNSIEEYKEYLAAKIYEFFGVAIPKTLLVEKVPDDELLTSQVWGKHLIKNTPKIHIMSQFVGDFKLLGENFIEDYKMNSKRHKKQLFHINDTKVPLKGFGRIVAVAILIHDYDFIGNAGRNIGYIPKEDGKYFEILKIDPGEALRLADNIKDAFSIKNPLNKRGAVGGTGGQRVNYDDLNEIDQKEFVQTLKEILEVKVSKLEEIFAPFFQINSKFRTILEELLNRREQFLAVFFPEIDNLIALLLRILDEKQAQDLRAKWGKSFSLVSSELEQKAELIRNRAQLGAFAVVSETAKSEIKAFQVSNKKEKFVGRDTELLQLKKLFSPDTGIIICAIVGSAGLGKSHLATEYIIRNQKETYSHVVWLHAHQSDLVLDQIQIYLETCFKVKFDSQDQNKKATVINKLYQILCNGDDPTTASLQKSLIIFDDADSTEQIADYLPDNRSFPKARIDILVTSRYKKWDHPLEKIIVLQPFGTKETQNYIKQNFCNSEKSLDSDRLSNDAEKLNNLLGGLPLAISLAIAYIQQKGISVSEFCDYDVEENKKEFIPLVSQEESEKGTELDQENEAELNGLNFVSVILTLALADLRIKNQKVESILDILAYLSPHEIGMSLLKQCWMRCNPKESIFGPEIANIAYISSETGGMKSFSRAFELLLSYSIITINPISTIQNKGEGNQKVSIEDTDIMNINIHQLTQQVIRLNHQRSGIYNKLYTNVFDWALAELEYDKKDMEDVYRAGRIVPHAIYLEGLQNNIKELEMAKLLDRIGSHQLYGVGKYDISLKYCERALIIKERLYGSDHIESGDTLNHLGNVWGSLGDYEKQKNLLTRALEIKEKHYGRDHPKTAITLAYLGNAWGDLGDYEKQKDLLIRALEINEKHCGKDHPEAGDILTYLGNAWGDLGDYEKQRDVLIRALKINENHYGKDHPETGATLGSLGNVWGDLGDYEKQRDLLIQALEIDEKHYGKDHPKTGGTLTNLGIAWGYLGDYEKEKDLYTRALEIDEKHYGKDHPKTAITLSDIGIAWGYLGDYEKKKDFLTRALKINENHYGKDHPKTSATLGSLGVAWGQLGNYEREKDLLTRALEIDEKFYGKDHPQTGTTLRRLGVTWGCLGDYERQKDFLTRALEIREKHYGEDNPETATTLQCLGIAWGSLGDYEKQKDLLTRALETVEKCYGKNHTETALSLNNLAYACGYLGEYEKQRDLSTQALEINEKGFGKDHIELAANLANLGNALSHLGDPEKAKQLLFRAIEINTTYYGENHSSSTYLYYCLGITFFHSKELEKAKHYLSLSLQVSESFYGSNHSCSGLTLMSLGDVYFEMKDHDSALGYQSRAYQIFSQKFGENHPHSIDSAKKIKKIEEYTSSLGDSNDQTKFNQIPKI